MFRLSVPHPPGLRVLPDLGPYEIHAGALTATHIGKTIAVQTPSAVIAGPLTALEESLLQGRTRLILRISTNSTAGDLRVGVHPSETVTVLPDRHKLSVTVVAPQAD